jgi:hypothetical protein
MRTQSWMVFCLKSFPNRFFDSIGFEWAQDLSPTNESIDDFVDPAQRDIIAGLLLNHEFPHQGDITLIDGPGFEGFVYGVCGIFFFNCVKRGTLWDNPRSRNHDPKRGCKFKWLLEDSNFLSESRRRELNPRPADYESAAMPLSHGGAIPHNIDPYRNKNMCFRNNRST